jgi:hypothetical protein
MPMHGQALEASHIEDPVDSILLELQILQASSRHVHLMSFMKQKKEKLENVVGAADIGESLSETLDYLSKFCIVPVEDLILFR